MNYYGEDYLAHFGVKGQKWGIRRFQNPDGTLTEAGKKHYGIAAQEFKSAAEREAKQLKFAKKLAKESTKLEKTMAKADLNLQKKIAEESDAKAAKAAKVGAGLAAATAGMLLSGDVHNLHLRNKERDAYYKGRTMQALQNEGRTTTDIMKIMGESASPEYYDRIVKNVNQQRGISNTLHTVAAGTLATAAVTSFGVAAYEKTKARVAKTQMKEVNHATNVAKMNKQYNKVVNMVKDTPYKAVLDARVEAYKQEHPGTELSDKQIMKNLM